VCRLCDRQGAAAGNLADKSVTGINTTFNGLNGTFYMLEQGADAALASLPAVQHRVADAGGKKH